MATTFDVDGSVRWKSADDLSRSEAPFDSAFDLPNRPHRLADLKAKNMFRSTGDLYGDSHDSLMRDLAHQISLRDLNSVSTSDLISGILSPHTVSKPSSSPSSSMGYSAPSSAPSKMIPALIEVRESVEDDFLRSVISDQTKFELSPAFTIYMVMRYLLSPRCSVGLSSPQRNQRLRSFAMKIADRLRIIIQENVAKGSLAFWLANASELLNMFKQDVDLSQITSGTIQSILSECVESAFLLLCSTMKQRLSSAIPSLSDPKMDDRAAATDTIVTFEEVIVLLRRCHLNAALTIQVFSQLFYFLNVTLFNWLVSPGGAHCCSTAFGVRLKRRLEHIHTWAKQKGLELAAECHMDRIQQAAIFLSTPKTMNEIKTLGSTCYVLNSLQVRWLLEHVVRDVGEEPLSDQLIENVVYLSQTQADKTAAQDGISVELREQTDLLLPFLLPQDGYAADSLRGIPPSLLEYVKQLETKGLCRMLLQPGSPGIWTVHFQGLSSSNYYPASQVGRDSLRSSETVTSNYSSPTPYKSLHPSYGSSQYIEPSATLKLPSLSHNTCVPEVILVSFFRGTSGIGLSIVAAQGIGERSTGIYVKKVVEGSAAHRDGRLQPGDQLLSVNGQSLVGISQEEAASKMASAGHTVHFEVSKQAARYNGLSEWLTNPPDTPVPQPYPRTMQKTPSGGHYSSTNTDVAQYPIDRNYSETGHQTSLGKTYHSPQSSYGSRDGVPFSYTNTSGLPPRGAYSRSPNHYAFPTNEPCHLRSTRSASASELYPDQTVTNSSTSATSLQQRGYPFIPSNKTNHYGASSSHYHHNLPSYYRSSTKAEQQRPMVIQPGRRSPVASHSHLKEASNVHYQSQPSTSNYSRPPERFSSVINFEVI
ncbi:hypothetical protein AB6A40_005628 [Gnathostoma spinigerum]|uniref:Afadin n=1 Tax=Gnathostoma spinigerum TaxID=75299 RepID=A0ABD6ENM4_9BILA